MNRIYQLKITLNDSSPRIWRRIQVPENYTFFDLHVAIQDAMGWTDSHLHAFYIAQKGATQHTTIRYPDPEVGIFNDPYLDERKEKISAYFGKIIKQCVYEYDFGDSWNHVVLFERELPVEPRAKYPLCVVGENACPPEDCGGVGGYERLQKIIKSPKHSEHKETLEWVGVESGDKFDPVDFNPQDVYFENPKKRLREYRKGFGVW